MSLNFIPRALSKPGMASAAGPSRTVHSLPPSDSLAAISSPPPPEEDQQLVRQASPPTSDATKLVGLVLSDYALWTTPEYRDPNRSGYVPLSKLISSSYTLSEDALSESSVIKSLRTHAADEYDVRMMLASSSKSAGGGYEIRRRDWKSIIQSFKTFNRSYWQERSIYIENLPHASRSYFGILRLFEDILPNPRTIQAISFPPHHQDSPDAQPKCKGFAVITLLEISDVSKVLADWPWQRLSPNKPDEEFSEQTSLLNEARKMGMRALSKANWSKLQDEYVAHRDKLLADAAEASSRVVVPTESSKKRRAMSPPPQEQGSIKKPQAAAGDTIIHSSGLSSSSLYPPGCVVRVGGIDPTTNKTSLRTLFTIPGVTIDYLDYAKGLDYCHLRLSSSDDALQLTNNAPEASKGLKIEILRGRQEEVYWEQVPDKICKQAVDKALAAAARRKAGGDEGSAVDDHVTSSSLAAGNGAAESTPGDAGGKRKRRRRK